MSVQADDSAGAKKENDLYMRTFAAIVETFDTEIAFREGLMMAATVLKNFRDSGDPKLNMPLVIAYEGAIKTALKTSEKMFKEAERIKTILPRNIVLKWQSVSKEINDLDSQIGKTFDNAEKSKLQKKLEEKKAERNNLSSEIAAAMKNAPGIFKELSNSINKIGELYQSYCAGCKDARRLYNIVTTAKEGEKYEGQFSVWTERSVKMKGINRTVFDHLIKPIQRPRKFELLLGEMRKNITELSETERSAQKTSTFEEALASSIEIAKKVGRQDNNQQELDDYTINMKNKIKVVSLKDLAKELDGKIKKLTGNPQKVNELKDLQGQKDSLEKKDIKELQEKRGEKFRERVQAALDAAIEFEKAFLLFSNSSPNSQEECKSIDKLKNDFLSKYKLITEDERKLIDALGALDKGKIKQLSGHKLINTILENAKNNASGFTMGNLPKLTVTAKGLSNVNPGTLRKQVSTFLTAVGAGGDNYTIDEKDIKKIVIKDQKGQAILTIEAKSNSEVEFKLISDSFRPIASQETNNAIKLMARISGNTEIFNFDPKVNPKLRLEVNCEGTKDLQTKTKSELFGNLSVAYAKGLKFSDGTEKRDRLHIDAAVVKEEGVILGIESSIKPKYVALRNNVSLKLDSIKSNMVKIRTDKTKIETLIDIDKNVEALKGLIQEGERKRKIIRSEVEENIEPVRLEALKKTTDPAITRLGRLEADVTERLREAKDTLDKLQIRRQETLAGLILEVNALKEQSTKINLGIKAALMVPDKKGDYLVLTEQLIARLKNEQKKAKDSLAQIAKIPIKELQKAIAEGAAGDKQLESVANNLTAISTQAEALEANAKVLAEKIHELKQKQFELARNEIVGIVSDFKKAAEFAEKEAKTLGKSNEKPISEALNFIKTKKAEDIPRLRKLLEEKSARVREIHKSFSDEQLNDFPDFNPKGLTESLSRLEKTCNEETDKISQILGSKIDELEVRVKLHAKKALAIQEGVKNIQDYMKDPNFVLNNKNITSMIAEIADLESERSQLERLNKELIPLSKQLGQVKESNFTEKTMSMSDTINKSAENLSVVTNVANLLMRKQLEYIKREQKVVDDIQKKVNEQFDLITLGSGNESSVEAYLKNTDTFRYIRTMTDHLKELKGKMEHAGDKLNNNAIVEVCDTIEATLKKLKDLENVLQRKNVKPPELSQKAQIYIAPFVEKYRKATYFEEYKSVNKKSLKAEIQSAINKAVSECMRINKGEMNDVASLYKLRDKLRDQNLTATPEGQFICEKISRDLENVINKVEKLENADKRQKRSSGNP